MDASTIDLLLHSQEEAYKAAYRSLMVDTADAAAKLADDPLRALSNASIAIGNAATIETFIHASIAYAVTPEVEERWEQRLEDVRRLAREADDVARRGWDTIRGMLRR